MFDSHLKSSGYFKFFSWVQIFVLTSFLVLPANFSFAQTFSVFNLPKPGQIITTSEKFQPLLIKGIALHKENPLVFDFILDPGRTKYTDAQIRTESQRLIKYFFAALTVPEKDLWVNLSPYEKDRMIPEGFGKTEMGRDLLAQDYILKQLSASLIYPEEDLGKDFWNRVYRKAKEVYGTTDIPVNTFNKVWIVPENAVVVESASSAYITSSKLKVMLEEDYMAMNANRASEVLGTKHVQSADLQKVSNVTSNIVRDIVLPEIEREVNEGKNFAQLRQIYYSVLLATWFKINLKENILNEVYTNKNKVLGVNTKDDTDKEKIYQQYLDAFRQGVFNYIKEDVDETTQELIPRKYFSGGTNLSATNAVDKGKVSLETSAGEGLMQGVNVRKAQEGEQPFINVTVGGSTPENIDLGGLPENVRNQVGLSRDRTDRMVEALKQNNQDEVNQILEEARVNLPGGAESRPFLFSIASRQASSSVNIAGMDISQIITHVREKANFELTPTEATQLKNQTTFSFDSVGESQRNGEVYVAALKSGLLGVRYVVTNIKRFSPNSHISYIENMQSLVDQFNGNLVILLSIEESPNVLKGDGAGFHTAIHAIASVLGENFLREQSLDVITDGGLKTRGGNITGKYGYNGVMPTSDGVNYYTRSVKTLGQVRLQHKKYGADRHFWTASDGDYIIGNISFGSRKVSNFENDGSWKMMIHGAEETLFKVSEMEQVFQKLANAETDSAADPTGLENILMQDQQIRDILENISNKKLEQLGENFADPESGVIAQFVEKPKPIKILQLLRDLNTNRIIPNAFMVVFTKDDFIDQVKSYQAMTSEGKRLSEYGGSYFQAIIDGQFNISSLNKQPDSTIDLFKRVHTVLPKEKILAGGLGSVGKFTDRGKTQFLSDAYWERLDESRKLGEGVVVRKGDVFLGKNVTLNVAPGSVVILENVRLDSPAPVVLNLEDAYFQNSDIRFSTSDPVLFQSKIAIVDSVIQKPLAIFGGDTVIMGLIALENQPIQDMNPNGQWADVDRIEIYPGETLVSIKNSNGIRYINRTLTRVDYKGRSLESAIVDLFADFQTARSLHPRLLGALLQSHGGDLKIELLDYANWQDNQGRNVSIEGAKSSMDYVAMNEEKLGILDSIRANEGSLGNALTVERGGAAGRWEFNGTSFDPQTRKWTLLESTRIPRKDGVVEPEFLIKGKNSPRAISLQTRDLNPAESIVNEVASELGINVPIRVIERDEVAIAHRIFAVGDSGAIGIREDVIAQADRNQIKEMLDHENRHLTGVPHDIIRQQQFQGGLTTLLKQLSAQDKRDKVGGIDFNLDNIKMEINKENGGIKVDFDPKILEEIRAKGIEGIVPVILNIQQVKDIVPLLSQAEGVDDPQISQI